MEPKDIARSIRTVMLHQVSAGVVGPLFNIASEVEEIQQPNIHKLSSFLYKSVEKEVKITT